MTATLADMEILAPDSFRMVRTLDADPATVWRYLTQAELRRQWFSGGTDAAGVGETVELEFNHDELSAEPVPYPSEYAKWKGAIGRETVVEFDPPHVFAISWDEGKEGTARFELSDAGGGRTRLTLTHSGITGPAPMADFGGGWHSHLAVLVGLLNGDPVRDYWEVHADSEARVAAALASAG